jgi:hypothetical protein
MSWLYLRMVYCKHGVMCNLSLKIHCPYSWVFFNANVLVCSLLLGANLANQQR